MHNYKKRKSQFMIPLNKFGKKYFWGILPTPPSTLYFSVFVKRYKYLLQ